jgi:DNA-binding response OmpR family regulator
VFYRIELYQWPKEVQMAKLLLVEDDEALATSLTKWLKGERHSVDRAGTKSEARGFLSTYKYDIIILDWELPDGAGTDLCAEIQRSGVNTPILMLTARGSVNDRITGLDRGADDYLAKPCLPEELGARIRALLRRGSNQTESLKHGPIELDLRARSLKVNGELIELRPSEFETFEVLMRHAGTILAAEAIVALNQSAGGTLSCSSIKVHISHIRSKFSSKGHSCPISPQPGGYSFEVMSGNKNE